jgi:hypothetical protein
VGASGSVDDYEVSYTYDKRTVGRRAITRSSMGLPDGRSLLYEYVGANNLRDSAAARVSAVWIGQGTNYVPVAAYEYMGASRVVRTDLHEPDLYRTVAGSSGEYPGLDLFDRLLADSWGPAAGTCAATTEASSSPDDPGRG